MRAEAFSPRDRVEIAEPIILICSRRNSQEKLGGDSEGHVTEYWKGIERALKTGIIASGKVFFIGNTGCEAELL